MNPVLLALSALFNVILGLGIAVIQILCFVVLSRPWRWVKLAYAIVGIYWAMVYLYILLVRPNQMDTFGAIFIRPAITLTLAMMMTGAIVRWRSGRGCE